jgi:demethylmenaquinone methyltransferase/2-methoxy-6-polyprenyl-1,4-benzoquinol methylase
MSATPTALEPGSGAMFDQIAHRYDLVNRILSFGIDVGWRRRAARSIGDARFVLDVATGTADLAIAIAQRLPRTRVTGCDPSSAMRAVGERKLATARLASRVTIEAGDAQRLAFPDRTFDATTIAFGIRNVPDRGAALREMARVTRDCGRVVVLELTEPRRGILAMLARLHIHWLVPCVGALLSGASAYRHLERSIARFPTPSEFANLMRASGLRLLEAHSLTLGVAHLFVAEPARPIEAVA